MLKFTTRFIVILITFLSGKVLAQVPSLEDFTPDPVKVQMYYPYLATRHGGPEGLEAWKKQNKLAYYQEIWYYTESFEIVRNHLNEGIRLEEQNIDITRYEMYRKPDEEAIIELPGVRDAIKLKPAKALLFKPSYVK